MKIVIMEFIDEFNAFLSYINKRGISLNDFIIVALEPRLQSYLKKQGISYRNTLPYFNNESHKKIIVETERVMNHVKKHFKYIDINGLKNCYESEFLHHIRFYLNHMFKILEVLENIHKENNYCEIFAYVEDHFVSSGMIIETEKYVGILVKNFAKKKSLKFIDFNEGGGSHILLKKSKKRWKFMENTIIKLMLFFLDKKRVIFMPRPGYLFKDLIAKLYKRDNKIIFLAIDYTGGLLMMMFFNLLSFIKSILKVDVYNNYYLINANFIYKTINGDDHRRLMESIDSVTNPQYEFLYKYNGISYYEPLKKKINIGLKRHMLWMLFHSQNIKYLFEKFSRRIVISYYALGIMAVAGELSRQDGVKSLFISHGAHPVPIDSYHEIELANLCKGFMLGDYTHIAVNTPIQEAHLHYFKRKYNQLQNREIKTGPLIFANLNGIDKSFYKTKLGFSSDDIIFTHAVTTKARQSERYYFIETLDEFFSSLSDIVFIVEKNKNIKLIIRIHPGFYLTDDEIKMLLPISDKFIIHRKGPFSEALAATDILISYSSTTIDEALINRIPALLYDKWNRYNHFKTGIFYDSSSEDIFPVCYVNNKTRLDSAFQYLLNKYKEIKKEKIDISKYCYKENYNNNFYRFILESLK